MFFTIPYYLERMMDEPVTLLSVLSVTAMVTTISLFFCGIPICLEIWRRKSTDDISGFPFLMGFLGGSFWLRYGLLKLDLTMITVNIVGVFLMLLYLMFYMYYTKPKTFFLIEFAIVLGLFGIMLVLVQIYALDILNPLGFTCMAFNILNFGAPLAGLTIVLKNRNCETLPLPLCTANLLVSSQWCLYGVLVHDIYIIIPNGAGIVLALLQISLFLIFPRLPGGRAPLAHFCKCVREMERNEKEDLSGEAPITPRTTLPQTSLNSAANGTTRRWMLDSNNVPEITRKMCIEFLRAQNRQTPWNLPQRQASQPQISQQIESSIINRPLGECSARTSTTTHSTRLTNSFNHSSIGGASLANVSAAGVSLTTIGIDFDSSFNRLSSMSHPDLYEDPTTSNPFQNSTSSQLALIFAAAASGENQPGVIGVQAYAQQHQQQQQLITASGAGGFDRIGDLDDLEKEWFERELKRAQSAPHLNKDEDSSRETPPVLLISPTKGELR